MKKALFTALIVLFCATPLMAQQAARNTGCGLGTILWDGNADGSIMSQSLQATTNGTFGNQTFGITSGTLGCDQPQNIAAAERLQEFVAANMDSLARDMAQGQGESLETLAELMSVPAAERSAFYASMQQNFEQIFVTGDETMANVLDRIVVAAN